jgi:cytochrome c-type biogenesis protein CcmH
LTLTKLRGGSQAMTDTKRFRLPSLPTLALIAAGIIAAASAAVAVSRYSGGGGESQSPAAKDWRVVGWAYAQAGDAAASAGAYRKATAIEPDNAENWSSLGESLQTGSTQVVPEAEAAFRKALSLDASDPRARYFLAVEKDLKGDHKGAVADWLALLNDTPSGAPWEADLRRTIQQTAQRYNIGTKWEVQTPVGGSSATAGIPGPTPEQLAAASSIPPSQQDQMVQGMVERLAARLKANPRDANGWIRLMRSRMVLGQKDEAKDALKNGLAAFAGDSAAQGQLKSAAAQLGIPAA